MALVALAANDAWNVINYRAGLVRALIDHGYEVAVIAPEGPNAEKVRALGATFCPLPMQPRGRSALADIAVFAGFRRLFRRLRPVAVLGFTAKPNIWGGMAARSLGIPLIANVSGLGAVFADGGPLMHLMSLLYRQAFAGTGLVFLQNPDDRELFIGKGIVGADKVRLVPGSGVDLDHFAPRRDDHVERECTFLFAGRLLWAKGVGHFVEASRELQSEGADARFQILGLPESGAEAVPLDNLKQWDEEGIIEYLGAVDDVRSAIGDSDCVVLPTFYREGVPHILLEAAAMAKPLIATDMPGCREAIDDGVSGLLVEPRSSAALTNAMRRIAGLSQGERATMGTAGRKKMVEQFDQRLVHAAYLDALGSLTS